MPRKMMMKKKKCSTKGERNSDLENRKLSNDMNYDRMQVPMSSQFNMNMEQYNDEDLMDSKKEKEEKRGDEQLLMDI